MRILLSGKTLSKNQRKFLHFNRFLTSNRSVKSPAGIFLYPKSNSHILLRMKIVNAKILPGLAA